MDQARTSYVQKTRPPRPSAGASRPPSLRAQQPGGTRHDSLDRNPHPAQGPQAPAGHVAGAMDALGRVTEGQPPRPDPNLAPAYLALMPLRASAVRVRRGAHHAHPQGMQGTPPERLHHRRSRRGRALSVNQPPRGIGSQSLSGTPTVGPRPGAGPGTGRCTWNARPLARLSESAPGRLSHKRRGEERSGANPRPHGWKEVGPVGRSGRLGRFTHQGSIRSTTQ